jgi:excisionase family DNA binding protein
MITKLDKANPAFVTYAYRGRDGMCNMNPVTARRWITVQDAADYTGLAPSTVRGMIARGIIPAFRLGRMIRVDLRALEKRGVARRGF